MGKYYFNSKIPSLVRTTLLSIKVPRYVLNNYIEKTFSNLNLSLVHTYTYILLLYKMTIRWFNLIITQKLFKQYDERNH